MLTIPRGHIAPNPSSFRYAIEALRSSRALGGTALGIALALSPLGACKSSTNDPAPVTGSASSAAPTPPPAVTAAPVAAATDELSRYKADLADRNQPVEGAQEATQLRLGPWRFFYRGSVDHPSEAAAITASGEIVSVARRNDWYKLLSFKAPEKEVGARFAWLLGGAVIITDGSNLTDPQAKAIIKPPVMKTDGDGTMHLNMFVIRPPDTQSPSRLHIGSPTVGRGYFDDAGWRNLIGQ